ncbi:MAG: hypothetical protein FWE29_04885 [Defluviitaleaceae bacterium]|nr:hypothetical protein [Defluviitaleaceae bacterium]
MAVNAGTVAAYLTLDTSQYLSGLADAQRRMITFASDMNRPMAALNTSFAQGTLTMLNDVTSARTDFLRRWLNDYAENTTSKGMILTRESVAHSNEFNRRLFSQSNIYRLDASNFEMSEGLKSDVLAHEAGRREEIIRESMREKRRILSDFVPVFLGIGTEYGEALLSGIISTAGRIQSHLASVAEAVRNASSGGSVGINSNVVGFSGALSFNGMNYFEPFSGSPVEHISSFNESMSDIRHSANEAAVFGLSARNVMAETRSDDRAFGSMPQALGGHQEALKALPETSGGLVYSPTYISPTPASIDELMVKDQIMMRRLGLSF